MMGRQEPGDTRLYTGCAHARHRLANAEWLLSRQGPSRASRVQEHFTGYGQDSDR
ncbi:MAG: hypothetical protein JWM11_2086 [Planctomycetaceae bacterium]|nr:hypothetical protein [Planctomycetaceae bacterium]